jgi:hypothetical protein
MRALFGIRVLPWGNATAIVMKRAFKVGGDFGVEHPDLLARGWIKRKQSVHG